MVSSAVRVMDQTVRFHRTTLAPLSRLLRNRLSAMDCLVQSVQNKALGHRSRDTPADDFAGEHINHKGHIDHAHPG